MTKNLSVRLCTVCHACNNTHVPAVFAVNSALPWIQRGCIILQQAKSILNQINIVINTSRVNYLSMFPREIWVEIFNKVRSFERLFSMRSVCRLFRELIPSAVDNLHVKSGEAASTVKSSCNSIRFLQISPDVSWEDVSEIVQRNPSILSLEVRCVSGPFLFPLLDFRTLERVVLLNLDSHFDDTAFRQLMLHCPQLHTCHLSKRPFAALSLLLREETCQALPVTSVRDLVLPFATSKTALGRAFPLLERFALADSMFCSFSLFNDLFQHCPSLYALSVAVPSNGVGFLFDWLPSSLRELTLPGDSITNPHTGSLLQTLASSCPQLQQLSLGLSWLQGPAGADLVRVLLDSCRQLRDVEFTACVPCVCEMAAATAAACCSQLQRLCLESFSAASLQVLASGVCISTLRCLQRGDGNLMYDLPEFAATTLDAQLHALTAFTAACPHLVELRLGGYALPPLNSENAHAFTQLLSALVSRPLLRVLHLEIEFTAAAPALRFPAELPCLQSLSVRRGVRKAALWATQSAPRLRELSVCALDAAAGETAATPASLLDELQRTCPLLRRFRAPYGACVYMKRTSRNRTDVPAAEVDNTFTAAAAAPADGGDGVVVPTGPLRVGEQGCPVQ